VILGLHVKHDELLLAIRSGDENCEFRRCNVNWTESTDRRVRGYIWDRVDEISRKAYLEAASMALVLPASVSLVKKIQMDKKLEDEIPGYRKWRAGIELPGDQGLFSYGFIPSTDRPDDGRSELIFFALAADYLRRMFRAIVKEDDSREIQFIPEQLGLARLASRSASDREQIALVHFDRGTAVVVITRSGQFFRGRYFRIGGGNAEDVAVDIETFLLSFAGSEELFPLIVTGSVDSFKTSWSPILPAFLAERDLEFSSVWGVTEFVSGGGRCELQAGL
jgi:hypothetical protein